MTHRDPMSFAGWMNVRDLERRGLYPMRSPVHGGPMLGDILRRMAEADAKSRSNS